jgi:hypothetical protein
MSLPMDSKVNPPPGSPDTLQHHPEWRLDGAGGPCRQESSGPFPEKEALSVVAAARRLVFNGANGSIHSKASLISLKSALYDFSKAFG